MKKITALMLMISSLLLHSVSYAADSTGTLIGESKNKNGLQQLQSADTLKDKMPCFGLNDILEFDVSDLTTEKQLTLISYKVDDETLGNENIQYINQHTLDAGTFKVKYTIRETTDGIYRILVNGGDGKKLVDFYYKVGIPTYGIEKAADAPDNGTNYYRIIKDTENKTYSVGFLGKITMDGADVSFADVGIKDVGFALSEGDSVPKNYFNKEPLTGLHATFENLGIDIQGAVTFIYGMEVHNIPEGTVLKADAIVDGGKSIDVGGAAQ